jgi:hypothetical protein
VREQLRDRDAAGLVGVERLQVLRYGIRHRQLALVHQHEHRRSHDGFGVRRHPEERVLFDGQTVRVVSEADGLVQHDLSAPRDVQHGAADVVSRDGRAIQIDGLRQDRRSMPIVCGEAAGGDPVKRAQQRPTSPGRPRQQGQSVFVAS